jgi:hypothetical protein
MMNNCARAVIFFFLVGVVSYGFTKNMVVILSACLLLTTMLVTCGGATGPLAHNDHHYVEGFEKGDADGSGADGSGADGSGADGSGADGSGADGSGADETKSDESGDKHPKPSSSTASTPASCKDGKTWNKDKKACEASSTDGMTTVYKKNNRVDYAATVEDAYDDLNKILGGEGMKNLSKDTQSLVTHQKELTEAMKSMGPLMEQASSMMGQMGGKGGLGSMLKKFSNAAPVGASN